MNRPTGDVDAYMPYYGKEFEAATKGYKKVIKWCYLTALWHYWHHTHCAGIPDNDDYQRNVCELEGDPMWEQIKPIIFGVFFKLDSGMWHQKRMLEIFNHVQGVYKKRVALAGLARQAKLGPDIKLDNSPDTKDDKKPDSGLHSKSKSNSNTPFGSGTDIQREGGGLKPPSLQDVKARSHFVGLTEKEAEDFWNHYEAIGWVNGSGLQIVNWQSKMAAWRNNAQSEKSAAKNGGGDAAQKVLFAKELDRINEAIRKLSDGAASDAMGTKYYSPQDKERLTELKARRKELRGILGVTI